MVEVDKRAFVAGLYPAEGWKKKVARMPDAQVTAIYLHEKDKENKETKQSQSPKPKESGSDEIPF